MTTMMWIPTGWASDHWNTIRSQRDGAPMMGDRLTLVLVPVVLGALAGISKPDSYSVILDATAIITALLFGLLVHIFTLGLSATGDDRIDGTWVLELIDQLRINISYAIVVGLLAVGLLAFAGGYDRGWPWIIQPAGAVGIALDVHLFMTLGMIVKRTNKAYTEMRHRARPTTRI